MVAVEVEVLLVVVLVGGGEEWDWSFVDGPGFVLMCVRERW